MSSGTGGRRRRREPPKRGATRKAPHGAPSQHEPGSQPTAWIKKTRSGARAARGYHYQDTVGAWLSVQVLGHRIDAHSITPEGKDDLVLVRSAGDHLVQVKSKQAHASPFSAAEIARLLLEGLTRAESYSAARVTVCLEHIAEGLPSPEWDTTLLDLPPTDIVRAEFERLVAKSGATSAEVKTASRKCGFVHLDWQRAEHEACRWLVELKNLNVPQIAEPVLNALRQAVADTTDANAPAHLTELSLLTRTDLDHIVTEVLRTTDSSHLAEAVELGLCSAVRFQSSTNEENYYEGVSTQPRHVAAGLVFQPAGVLDTLFERLAVRGALLLIGPSGVGKSARAWSLVKHVPSVAWFRIDRLTAGDAAIIARFASAMRPSQLAPVGFIFDQLTASAADEFEELRSRLARSRHAYLLATVRNEDLLTLRSAHEVDVAAVELDPGTAEGIFTSLQARSLAVRSSWQESFEQSHGLTLEFTHLLTQGRRLSEVIDAQMNERLVDPRRANEVKILARVCQADSWGVTLSTSALQQEVELDDGSMRQATLRLAQEHLIATPMEHRVRGLHPLRSKAIAAAIHRQPPPTWADTRRSLLAVVDDRDVGAIAFGALVDGAESDVVVTELVNALKGAPVPRIASALRGVRLADFRTVAETWCSAMEEAGVPPSLADITASLHMTRSDVEDLPLHPSIPVALAKLRDLTEDLPTHRRIIQGLDAHVWGEAMGHATDIRTLTDMLTALGPGDDCTSGAESPAVVDRIADLLRKSTLADVAQCLSTAKWVHPNLADRMEILAGRDDAILARIKDSDPFMTEVTVLRDQGEAVATCRLVHLSDTLQPDPELYVRDVAGLMLRALPSCDRADVRATLVGGHHMELNGYRPWESGLSRRYAISDAEVAWNRTRGLVVQEVMRERLDPPPRSETIPALILDAGGFLALLTTAWSTSRNRTIEVERLNAQRLNLGKQIDELIPLTGQHKTEKGAAPLVQLAQAEGVPEAAGSDHVHTLLAGLVFNVPERLQQPAQWGSLAAFCHDTLTAALCAAADEVRASTDADLDEAIDGIGDNLRDLYAILAELAWGTWTPADVTRWARSGAYGSAVSRAAAAARSAADLSAKEAAARILVEGQENDLDLRVQHRNIAAPAATNWPPSEYAIGVVLKNIYQWESASEQVGQIVDLVLPTGHAPTVLYPLIDGRAIGSVAHARITTSHPGAESFATWREELADVAPEVITDAFVKAHQALQELSGLMAMKLQRPEVDYQPYVDAATARFREGVDELISARDNEAVVESIVAVLNEMAVQVWDESGHDPRIQPGTFAKRVTAGGLGRGDSTEWTTMNALLLIAVLCDINPRLARELLDGHVVDQPTSATPA